MSRNLVMVGAILLAVAAPLAAEAADVEIGQPMAIPTPVPGVPSVHPSAPVGGLASAPAPAAPHYAPAPNLGPVTGYGPGGMGAMPGAPANPPYSSGGFGARR